MMPFSAFDTSESSSLPSAPGDCPACQLLGFVGVALAMSVSPVPVSLMPAFFVRIWLAAPVASFMRRRYAPTQARAPPVAQVAV